MSPLWGMDRVSIWFEGSLTSPRLNHPEGICVDQDGNIWCGGEEGEIYRIDRDGTNIERMATTGGFGLGIAIDSRGILYMCDMKDAAVYRYDPKLGKLDKFAEGDGRERMACPNFPVIDEQRGFLYVSDSRNPGPGIWRFQLDSGQGELWYGQDCVFANGMALSPRGDELFLIESFAEAVFKVPIEPDGSAGEKVKVADFPGTVPDGLAFDRQGRLYISCYEPSQIYRYDFENPPVLLVHDTRCTELAHPTNIAFRGEHELFCASLGRCQISLVQLEQD